MQVCHRAILAVNYWPIFHTSRSILRLLPTRLAANILNTLWGTAETLVAAGVTRSHDLTGTIFQRLIADRKFLATFYTRPSAATLLAGLALPRVHHRNWADANALTNMRIGDFACGTGTLLSAAYSRLGLLHQIHGGNPATLHPAMMERGLVGLEICPQRCRPPYRRHVGGDVSADATRARPPPRCSPGWRFPYTTGTGLTRTPSPTCGSATSRASAC